MNMPAIKTERRHRGACEHSGTGRYHEAEAAAAH